jgi:hypothetical protein
VDRLRKPRRAVEFNRAATHEKQSIQEETQKHHISSTGRENMAESVYKIIEVVGTSAESWEKAATAAVNRAAKTLRDLRVAEIVQLDMQISDGKVEAYRAKVRLSFKFED